MTLRQSRNVFVIRDKDRWKQDYFQDEVCLVLEDKGELVVIVGCSHPGILNILDTVKASASPSPYAPWWEGPTWWRLTGERIHKTIRTMRELGIGLLGFNHCSGELCKA